MSLADVALYPLRWRTVRTAAIRTLLLKERLQSGIAIDPLSEEFRDNPYPKLHELRERDPVHRLEMARAWFLTRYEDVNALLRDPSFLADKSPLARSIDAPWRRHSQFQQALENSLLGLDPPRHTRLRSLVSHAFTPRVVESMRATIEDNVREILERVEERGEMDVVRDLSEPLPLRVIANLLGVPVADHALFRIWSNHLAQAFDIAFERQTIANADRAVVEMTEYFRRLLHTRPPGEDLLSALAAVEEGEDRLSEEELYSFCILLLVAGHETTTDLISNGTLALLRSGKEPGDLSAEPDELESAIEELLRFDPPVQLTARTATHDLELHGKRIRRGDMLILSIAAANRDPAVFPDPDILDLDRTPNRHLSFSAGHHYCVGAPLARLEGQIVFARLAERFPRMRLKEGTRPQRRDALSIRSLSTLQVEIG